MSHDIISSIITAVATLLSPFLVEFLRNRKQKHKSGDGKTNIPVNKSDIRGDRNSVTQIVDQSRTSHTYNIGVVKSGASDDDAFMYLLVAGVVALLVLVGVGLFGHPILIGVASSETLFTIFLLVVCLVKKSQVNLLFLAGQVFSVILTWIAVHRIESMTSFMYFTNAVADGSIGQKMGIAFRNHHAGISVFLTLFLMVVSVLCLMFSEWELLKKTEIDVVEIGKVGKQELVLWGVGVVLLFVLCVGSGYFDSWMMHMNSRS